MLVGRVNEEETTSDRLIISLACEIGIVAEEIDTSRRKYLSWRGEQDLLIGEVEPLPERSTIEVATVYVPDKLTKQERNWTTHAAWAAVALFLAAFCPAFGLNYSITSAKAERDWLSPGPPLTRLVKTSDGHFYIVTATRARSDYPYVEWLAQREIEQTDVENELTRLR